MEVGFRKVDGIPAYKMWISRIIGTFIEVGHDLLRQEIRIQPHQRKWDGNNQFPRLHTLNFIKIPMPTIEFNQGGKVKGYWLYF